MNLSGSIAEHQHSLQRMYQKLADRFAENGVIRALWRDMSEDVSLQIQGLKSLPNSFWNQLKKAPDDRLEAAVKGHRPVAADTESVSLRESFELTLQSSEPVILKIYARIVRLLRSSPVTDQSLDFYILVKAHAARIVRITESFAGDPTLIRRARMLLQGLEKEVQEPDPEEVKAASQASKKPKAAGATAKLATTKPAAANATATKAVAAKPSVAKQAAAKPAGKQASGKPSKPAPPSGKTAAKPAKASPKRPAPPKKKTPPPVQKAKARR
ncbi:MAG: hypothetical protein LBT74_06840 [Acidobacteriota bacterium]|jgi:hypothetical protein|nr:hypothetical protein [Acidobacteriota bacterium]